VARNEQNLLVTSISLRRPNIQCIGGMATSDHTDYITTVGSNNKHISVSSSRRSNMGRATTISAGHRTFTARSLSELS